MRSLIAVLHTIVGALAGSTITLGIVAVCVVGPGSAQASRLLAAALILAGSSVACFTATAVVQHPKRAQQLPQRY
ncbi:hypothetical protein [Curtobacterium luteum]|uniref:hypothetical protein n=1 Tax=Curtobacterium luteum TaxID=33881 RepID=UPI00128EA16E|nr:hypothetical protein [Curtobacterium luteum]